MGDLSCSQTIMAVKAGPHWDGKDASLVAGTSASTHHPRGAQQRTQSWQRLLVVALTWRPVAPDYPYSLVSRELRGTIRGLLAKAAGSLELFFDHCLFTMLQELDKTPGETPMWDSPASSWAPAPFFLRQEWLGCSVSRNVFISTLFYWEAEGWREEEGRTRWAWVLGSYLTNGRFQVWDAWSCV